MPHLFVHLVGAPRAYLLGTGETVLGRGEGADIRLADDSLSRRHAVLRLKRGRLEVGDLGSKNGTWVNEVRLLGAAALADADRIRFGSVQCELVDVDDALALPIPEAPRPEDAAARTRSLRFKTPGRAFGPYQLERPLGEGAVAMVWSARHRERDTRHALKILQATDPSIERRFRAEARLQGALAHPNVVRVDGLLEAPEGVAIVLELVDGHTLRERLASGPIPLDEARRIGSALLAGLEAAHAAGLVHRDVKPANVLLREDGTPLLADFGLARPAAPSAGPALTELGIGLGTPGYMAPEAYRAAATLDQRADVFGAGAVLYELVTGERAFDAPAAEAARLAAGAGYVPPERLRPDLPGPLRQAIHGALDPDPARRIATVRALRTLWDRPGA